LQHGEITFDRPAKETSVAELLDLVHAEYRLNGSEKSVTDSTARDSSGAG
jgi:hypothetical protein